MPRKHPTNVTSPIIDSMANARVEILIDEATHRWNHLVIDDISFQRRKNSSSPSCCHNIGWMTDFFGPSLKPEHIQASQGTNF